MTGEGMAAVVGASAGAGSAVGWWAANWHRDHVPMGQKQLLQYFYPYVDGRIGATDTENLRRANRRFRFVHPRLRRGYLFVIPNSRKLPLREMIANYLWPEVKLARGGNPLPEAKRITRYIQFEFDVEPATWRRWLLGRFAAGLYRLWNIRAVVIWPTSEVDVWVHGFEASLRRWVAWALRTTPDELVTDPDPEKSLKLGYIRFTRKGPAPEFRPTVPVGVAADA